MPARRRSGAATVVRTTEATGESPRGWEAAVAAAVKRADVADALGVEVVRLWAEWNGRRLSRYHATVKVAYRQALKAAPKR
ncbi:MAG TPA: dodecin domain-containing protein [Candidatus Limnocylindria bacterium]